MRAVKRIMALRDRKEAIMKVAKAKATAIDEEIDRLTKEFVKPVLVEDMTNLSTAYGTAIKKHCHGYKPFDRSALNAWIVEQVVEGNTEALDIKTAAVSKSYLDEYVESFNDLPPGIERKDWEEIQFRRPTPGKVHK